ncbi:MAG: hypothetical protein LBB65_00955, partial [Burkholderiales bacterium]|nr:hypothetical protein [Burkholderiales bacterium]
MSFLLSHTLTKLPVAGQKITLPAMAGSGDALALAQTALLCIRQKSTLLIVCEDSAAVRRLEEEIRWWLTQAKHPQARIAVFPDGET